MSRFVFVILHPHVCDDFFSDMPFSECSGQLRAGGHHSRVVQLYLHRDDPDRTAALLRRLLEHLRLERYDVVAVDQVWDTDILARIKEVTDAALIHTDPFARPSAHVDHLLEHFSTNPLALLPLARAAAEGADTAAIPNAWSRRDGSLERGAAPAQPRPAGDPLPFRPDLDHLLLNERFRPPVLRKTLSPNCGCPHGPNAADNPRFHGVDLRGEGVSARGCSFCHQGGDYQGRPASESADLALDHIAEILARQPAVQQFILRDQSCLRYLPGLLRGADARGLGPLDLLVSARADMVLRSRRQLERALELADAGGHRVELYLIGLENLSQPVLDLYNKGMTVAQCVDALALARELAARHPRSFPLGRHRTSSFILFNPWITLDDLAQNLRLLREHRVDQVAADLVLTKLRLYPNLPLFHLARRDGLLLDSGDEPPPGQDNAAAAGYSAEHAWRFSDPRCGLVYDLLARAVPRVSQDRQLWLLELCLGIARGFDDGAPLDEDAAVARLEAALDDGEIRLEDHEERSPDTINIATTCNQRCVFCAGYSLSPVDDAEVLAHLEGRREVFFQGGEPTLNEDLFRYVRHALAHGCERVTLVTNGLRLAYPDYARRCVDAGIHQLFFALPSHRREVNDELSRVPGSFALKRKALDNLADLGALPRVRLVHLVSSHNHRDLPDLVRFVCREYPSVQGLEIKLMQCLGRVEENREMIPTFTELAPLLERCLDHGAAHGLNMVVNGVPPCMVPRHRRRIMDHHMREVSGQRVSGRRYLPCCDGCPLRESCLGVRADYLKIHGGAEVQAARRALDGGAGGSAAPPPSAAPPAPPPDAQRGEAELHAAATDAMARDDLPAAHRALRQLVGLAGNMPSAEQLRAPTPPRFTEEALSMRGFKPAELCMLRHGLKPVVKLEDIPEAQAREFCQQHGHRHALVLSRPYTRDDLATDQRPGPGQERLVTIYASTGDEGRQLRDLDREAPRDGARQAADLLGYPTCCADHFARAAEAAHEAGQGINEAVTRSMWANTPDRDLALPYQMNLFSDLGLLSFYPCSLRCEHALRWARRVERHLTADAPDDAARARRAMSRPVLFLRLPFFALFQGRLAPGGSLLYESFSFNEHGALDNRRLQRLLATDLGRLLAAGDRLTVTDEELQVARADRLVARLPKAAPGACLLFGFAPTEDTDG